MEYRNSLSFARQMDREDPLRSYRERFYIPEHQGKPGYYFTGNSLGLQPRSTEGFVQQELLDWRKFGVEGHLQARHPWLAYHEYVRDSMTRIAGALPSEVVVMNTLTVNLHLLMVSFYRPAAERRCILIEANAFPSDQYAVASQLRYHGYDPQEALLTLPLRAGEVTHRMEDIAAYIDREGDRIALMLLGGVNYYTGQAFDMAEITRLGRRKGCVVGWDLAHAAGNLPLQLHDWDVDFAAWCSYKYLNAGPGGIAGAFVHQRHAESGRPRFAGWWGHNKERRFLMESQYHPIPGAEGWQLSNPPILPLAALRASMEIFDEVGMPALRKKSLLLSGYLAFLLDEIGMPRVSRLTPESPAERGCQFSLVVPHGGRAVFDKLAAAGVICDWREPDVIRVAPVPLYNSFEDVWQFGKLLQDLLPG